MNNQNDEKYKKFQCKICLDLAKEPVITPCGHLHCWQCLYTWAQQKNPLLCQNCSNIFELNKVTTIFIGESKESKQSEIPKRPTNPRQQQQQQQQQQQFGNFQFGFSFGMPFMMMSNFNLGQGQQANARSFMIIFFIGFFLMNFLPFFTTYTQETPQQTQRQSRRHQETVEEDDYLINIGMSLAIILGFTGLSYIANKILNK